MLEAIKTNHIRAEEGATENRYVLTFHFENNYNYSRVFTLNELLHDFGYFQWQTIGKGWIQERKRQFLVERRLTFR